MTDKESTYEAIESTFTEYLRKHNQRKTPERFAILKRIYNTEGHFNAEDLYKLMSEEYRVSLATIYNTLELMIDAKLIIRHQFDSQIAQFEKIFGNTTHHHLVCSSCGQVREFSDKQIRTGIQARKFARFQMTHYSLYIFGICNKCKDNTKNRKK